MVKYLLYFKSYFRNSVIQLLSATFDALSSVFADVVNTLFPLPFSNMGGGFQFLGYF